MFGTGESPSSSSESITPSTISSSCVVGTYCCHIGSPTSLIVARTFGVIRIWKLSNAGSSDSVSMTSSPYFLASLSRVSMLSWRLFCQSLMRDQLPSVVVLDCPEQPELRDLLAPLRITETLGIDHP